MLTQTTTGKPQTDSLRRFVFEHTHVRGLWVHLDASWKSVLERQSYPSGVRDLLGQAMAAATLLSATIKFKGKLTLQIKGEGMVRLLVVQTTSHRTLRGMAEWEGKDPQGSLQEMFGNGRLVITIEREREKERYQGIVELTGDTLSQAIEAYFRNSEQLNTRLWLEADDKQAAGFLLQELPGRELDQDGDAWNRIESLGSTLTSPELLGLSTEDLLYRLYHEEQVRVYKAEPIQFHCGCSRERIEKMFITLGEEEMQSILSEQGNVEVDCEFCRQHFRFDPIDVQRLFGNGYVTKPSKTLH